MWFVTAALAAAPPPSVEEETAPAQSSEELRALAKARTTRGAAEVGIGLGLAAGGVFVLSFQRGESGAISQEEPWLMDVRSIGGGLLIVGGLTTLVVGGNDISVGRRLRLEAATVTPALLPGGAGAVVSARF